MSQRNFRLKVNIFLINFQAAIVLQLCHMVYNWFLTAVSLSNCGFELKFQLAKKPMLLYILPRKEGTCLGLVFWNIALLPQDIF